MLNGEGNIGFAQIDNMTKYIKNVKLRHIFRMTHVILSNNIVFYIEKYEIYFTKNNLLIVYNRSMGL